MLPLGELPLAHHAPHPILTLPSPSSSSSSSSSSSALISAGPPISSTNSFKIGRNVAPSFPSLALKHPPSPSLRSPLKQCTVCAQDLKEQMKQMAAAEKRWESQIKEGKVKSLSAKEAGYAMQLVDYVLLDVRPSTERNKAWPKGSIWVPIYDVDESLDPAAVLKKLSNFVMGGWWSGLSLMKYNERFLPDVVAKIPKNANIIVACQKGLRSLSACEFLYKAGYRNLFWLNGGLDAVEEGDLEREGPQPFKFAGIGGVSEFLGWTDVQRSAAAKEGLVYRAMLFGRLVAVVLVVDAVFFGAQQLYQHMHNLQ